MQIKGIITNVGPQKSGTNSRGDWSVQKIDLKDGETKINVTVWNRPDLQLALGKFVIFDGIEDSKDKNGNAVKSLPGGKGSINVKDVQHLKPGAKAAAATRTIDDYEKVLGRAIRFVYQSFRNEAGAADVSHEAVAHVVNGYMVGHSRGDFHVPAAPTQTDPPADEDIPF